MSARRRINREPKLVDPNPEGSPGLLGDQPQELSLRQHPRYRCDLAAEVTVGAAHAALVRPARNALTATGIIAARVTDVSLGGLALTTAVFLPKSCQLRVRVLDPSNPGAVLLEAAAVIRRASMIDRRPTYCLGTSFTAAGPELAEMVHGLLAVCRTTERSVA